MKQELIDLLNSQINMELQAEYTYSGMAVYLDSINLKGCAHWMRIQAAEEREHAMKLVQYLQDCGYSIVFNSLTAVKTKYSSVLDVFSDAHSHEKMVTKSIHNIYDKADLQTRVALLNWFVKEQVEEEEITRTLYEQFLQATTNYAAVLILDNDLKQR